MDGFGESRILYILNTYGNNDVKKVILKVDESLTERSLILLRVNNDEADEGSTEADKFYDYLKSDTCKRRYLKIIAYE